MPVAELRPRLSVRFLAAAIAALTFAASPTGASAAIAAFVAAVLVVIAAVDLHSMTIPNRVVLPATALVLLADAVFTPARAPECLLAALLAGVVLLLPNLINSSWMGMGDVKLGLLLGAALGWGVLGALEIAFTAVVPFALAIVLRQGRTGRSAALPFGPFMAFGALVVLIVPRLVGIGA